MAAVAAPGALDTAKWRSELRLRMCMTGTKSFVRWFTAGDGVRVDIARSIRNAAAIAVGDAHHAHQPPGGLGYIEMGLMRHIEDACGNTTPAGTARALLDRLHAAGDGAGGWFSEYMQAWAGGAYASMNTRAGLLGQQVPGQTIVDVVRQFRDAGMLYVLGGTRWFACVLALDIHQDYWAHVVPYVAELPACQRNGRGAVADVWRLLATEPLQLRVARHYWLAGTRAVSTHDPGAGTADDDGRTIYEVPHIVCRMINDYPAHLHVHMQQAQWDSYVRAGIMRGDGDCDDNYE